MMSLIQNYMTPRWQLGETWFISSSFLRKWCTLLIALFKKRFKLTMTRREISISTCPCWIGKSLRGICYTSRDAKIMRLNTNGQNKNSLRPYLRVCKVYTRRLEPFLRMSILKSYWVSSSTKFQIKLSRKECMRHLREFTNQENLSKIYSFWWENV